MEKNKYILIILGVVIISFIFLIIFFNGGDKSYATTNKSNELESKTIISPVEKASKYTYSQIVPVVKPTFKVGDLFEYKQKGSGMVKGAKGKPNGYGEGEVTVLYQVERIERINKTDYYVISESVNNSFHAITEKGPLSSEQHLNGVHYVDVETGEFLKSKITVQNIFNGVVAHPITQNIAIPKNMKPIYGGIFFFPWMLALTDDFKAEINFTENGKTLTEELEIVGTEILNNRECFKVKKTIVRDNKVESIEYIWVDKKRRITLKSETFVQNVKVYTVNLISNVK